MPNGLNNIFMMGQGQLDKADQWREFFFAMIESIPGRMLLPIAAPAERPCFTKEMIMDRQ